MNRENKWLDAADEDLLEAEENISDYNEVGQRAILEEVERRRKTVPNFGVPGTDSQGQVWTCRSCGAQVEVGFDVCWSCQADRNESGQNEAPVEGAARQEPDRSKRERATRSLAEQLEKRYRDAYHVARATIMAAGFVKFVGITFAVVGVAAAFLIAQETATGAAATGVVGVSSGILIFGVGILIAAQGQQLLTSVDDVIGSSPFLTDVERAEVMRLDIGDVE